MSNIATLSVTQGVYCNKQIQQLISNDFRFYKLTRFMNQITILFSKEKHIGYKKVSNNGTLYCPELTNIKSKYNMTSKENLIVQGKLIIKVTLCAIHIV